jgi:hypothetical protein
MDEIMLARALHVLGVVLWIGGVGMVTTVLLPAVRRFRDSTDRIALFESIEGRFAGQARFSSLLVGGTGFYMTWEALGSFSRCRVLVDGRDGRDLGGIHRDVVRAGAAIPAPLVQSAKSDAAGVDLPHYCRAALVPAGKQPDHRLGRGHR